MTRQSGLNMQRAGDPPPWRGNVVVRGVVTAVYYADDPAPRSIGQEVKCIACDVLTYGRNYRFFLPRVPVSQPRHSLNDYDLYTPRAATIDLSTGQAPVLPRSTASAAGDSVVVRDVEATSDPRNLDGDHVLVEFLENDPQQPFIRGDALPHPRAQYRPLRADGEKRVTRTRGVTTEVDTDGNVTIDATKANSGGVTAGVNTAGAETPAADASHGNVTVNIPRTATLTLRGVDVDGNNPTFELTVKDNELHLKLQNGETLKLVNKDGATVMTVGDGMKHVAIVEELQALWTKMIGLYDAHVHPTGVGPSGPPVPLLSVPVTGAPWDPAINSSKIKIPNG